jgi:hypothetical protein
VFIVVFIFPCGIRVCQNFGNCLVLLKDLWITLDLCLIYII